MDRFAKGVLTVIAVAICAIALRMWMPGYATLGELQAAVKSQEGPTRAAAIAAWQSRLVMVRMQGGTVDVDVAQMPSVDVNVTGMP